MPQASSNPLPAAKSPLGWEKAASVAHQAGMGTGTGQGEAQQTPGSSRALKHTELSIPGSAG